MNRLLPDRDDAVHWFDYEGDRRFWGIADIDGRPHVFDGSVTVDEASGAHDAPDDLHHLFDDDPFGILGVLLRVCPVDPALRAEAEDMSVIEERWAESVTLAEVAHWPTDQPRAMAEDRQRASQLLGHLRWARDAIPAGAPRMRAWFRGATGSSAPPIEPYRVSWRPWPEHGAPRDA